MIVTQDRVIVARRSSPYLNMSGAWTIGVGGVIGIALDVLEAKKKKNRERHEAKEYRELSLEEVLKANKNNYAIPNSDITEVVLKKLWRGVQIQIKTSKKYGKTLWGVDVVGSWKDVGEKYENMLRPIFGDRLSVKK